ncbi:MAG TPA: efflux RND transporter periplasmic adaptor subunit [Terriglobales bacterium]|nr:efflux RND transporter periplasmic adaptor subunit [Terriglobales bacterium]
MEEPVVLANVLTEDPAQIHEPPATSLSQRFNRSPKRPKRRMTAILTGALVVIVVTVYAFLQKGRLSGAQQGAVQTSAAIVRDFLDVVRLSGTTEAVRSRPVLAPQLAGAQLGTMVVTKMVPAGTHVNQGDLIVAFDQQAQIKDALDKKASYQDLEDQITEKQAAEAAARAKDQDDIHQALDDLQKAQLEMGKNEILSRIDVEKNQEALAEAQQTLKQLQHTFDLKRQAAAADIQTLEIQRDRARATMLYAESNVEKMAIHSPMDGVVVLNSVWLNGRIGEVQEGDEIRAGVPFMKIVDPSTMQVRVGVNQADVLKLQIGQSAMIHLDAYPSLAFTGTLVELSPVGHANDYSTTVRTFIAIFSIHQNNPKLMPDLSASVDVEVANIRGALTVPANSLQHDGAGDFVWLKNAHRFERRSVEAGFTDGSETVIKQGLKPGDVVRTDVNAGSS